MSRLVLDIETTGVPLDRIDASVRDYLLRDLNEGNLSEEEITVAKKTVEGELGLSPLTGQIVAIGVYDIEKDQGVVCFQAPSSKLTDYAKGNFSFKPMSEPKMLENFWQGVKRYSTFITFNGRNFDVPFLMIRAAIFGIRPTKNLLSNRYLNSQFSEAKHIDLFDQLTFYGSLQRKGGLHLWCRAFGIDSPKDSGMSGAVVGKYFDQARYKEIAEYNAQDLIATAKLYERWQQFLNL